MQHGLLLPLFPLHVVLFPGGLLPLHIFEERYKEMIAEAIRDKSEFGVMLATSGGIVNIGCTAVVEHVLKEYPDGRQDIMTRGKRRFELLLVNEERDFLRGSVEFFEDSPAEVDAAVKAEALDGYHQYRTLSSEEPYARPDTDDPQLSFRLAQPVSDIQLRQSLLATMTEASRLKKLAEFFAEHNAKERRIQQIKNLAPRNGHGPHKIQ